MVAKNSQSRCKEQDIPFFRFSPKFEEVIAAGETDNEKLFNLVIRTKEDLRSQQKLLDELINIFQAVAESSQDLSQEPIREESESKEHTVSESIQEEEEEEEASDTTSGQLEQDKKPKMALNEEKSPQEIVKTKLERISTASSELSKEVPTTPRELDWEDLTPENVFDGVVEDEDESISQLVESISEENNSLPQPKQEEFSENFLFNSINGELKKLNSGQQLDLCTESTTKPTTPIKSPLGTSSGASKDKALHSPLSNSRDHLMKTQSQGNVYDRERIHMQQSAQNLYKTDKGDILNRQRSAQELYKNMERGDVLHTQQSSSVLYKPYRTDTNEVDESHDEYTPYQRQTLV